MGTTRSLVRLIEEKKCLMVTNALAYSAVAVKSFIVQNMVNSCCSNALSFKI